MSSLQTSLLAWAANQPLLTGLVLLAGGVIYTFFGAHFFRFLLAATCGALGWLAGECLSHFAHWPVTVAGAVGAVALAAISTQRPRFAAAIANAAVWGLLGHYLSSQVHMPEIGCLVAAGLATLLGMMFSVLCPRTMASILTTLQGVILLLIGFVVVSSNLVPTIGFTFRDWAGSQALLVPVFLTMLFVTGYSYQAMHQRGDIRTGR